MSLVAVRFGSDLYPGAKDWLTELTSGANPGAHRTLAALTFFAPNNPGCLAALFADQFDRLVGTIVDCQSWFTRIALVVLAVYTVVQVKRLAGSADDLTDAEGSV